MIEVIFIEADGRETVAHGPAGQSLMQLAVGAGVPGIVAECGGACACGTCHCYIAQGFRAQLPPINDNERDMLEWVIDPKPESRLSCQIQLLVNMDGLVVRLPQSQT